MQEVIENHRVGDWERDYNDEPRRECETSYCTDEVPQVPFFFYFNEIEYLQSVFEVIQ